MNKTLVYFFILLNSILYTGCSYIASYQSKIDKNIYIWTNSKLPDMVYRLEFYHVVNLDEIIINELKFSEYISVHINNDILIERDEDQMYYVKICNNDEKVKVIVKYKNISYTLPSNLLEINNEGQFKYIGKRSIGL
jgi:hypothetical protein